MESGDELWRLAGADNLYILRLQEEKHSCLCYRLVGKVLDRDRVLPEVPRLMKEVVEMVTNNDLFVRTIVII